MNPTPRIDLRPLLRRCLLLTGLVLMTPACGGDFDTFLERQRPPTELIELSASEPVVTRRLRVVAAVKPGTRTKVSWPYLSVKVSRTWANSEASGAEDIYPWLRVRLVNESEGDLRAEDVVAFGEQGWVRDAGLANSPGREDKADQFDVTYRVEFERQGPPSNGLIKLTWESYASVSSSGDRDEVEFTVTEL
ncbi:hypothetical protein [Corallococcus terminator]|uniref:DUF4352 domain-containing protein n=1 Tax=Corallococcus terminator TaxID=2316733 RepID=A0A3A8HZ47_9BACT|nr:hypothetical protein [Corallococcus terminator]RKG72804.1 hypothetical protein D7V88_37555 [Corallococcus terminator]